jgi:hypothetical protein
MAVSVTLDCRLAYRLYDAEEIEVLTVANLVLRTVNDAMLEAVVGYGRSVE